MQQSSCYRVAANLPGMCLALQAGYQLSSDVWLQLLQQCLQDPGCQPAAVHSLAQQIAVQDQQLQLQQQRLTLQEQQLAQQQRQQAAQAVEIAELKEQLHRLLSGLRAL